MKVKFTKTLALFALSFLLASCAASKSSSIYKNAETSFKSGDYTRSLDVCEQFIQGQKAANKSVPGSIYNMAGLAASKLNHDTKTIEYLEQAKLQSAATPETYVTLAAAYLRADNLSKEITNLEEYRQNFADGEAIDSVNNQLFSAYVRSENWELGDGLWQKFSQKSRDSQFNINNYLIINKKLDRYAQSKQLADQLLKIDKNNVEALDFFADFYYERGDSVYVTEMKAYERKQTMKQYKRLTNKLKQVNDDFKKARDFYERLYKLKPQKFYAKRLGNIYTRFENKKKAKYYYKLAK